MSLLSRVLISYSVCDSNGELNRNGDYQSMQLHNPLRLHRKVNQTALNCILSILNQWNKGLYPQRDKNLAIVYIDASKGFVYLLVHLSFAIFAIFDLKIQLNVLEMACDQIQTCLIFPLRWACFPIKIGRNAQWVHLFSMDFNEFWIIYLIF